MIRGFILLKRVRVVEIAGIGPAPCCGMILADLGAEVILVERLSKNPNAPEVEARITGSSAYYKRGKKSIALDLKQLEPDFYRELLEKCELQNEQVMMRKHERSFDMAEGLQAFAEKRAPEFQRR